MLRREAGAAETMLRREGGRTAAFEPLALLLGADNIPPGAQKLKASGPALPHRQNGRDGLQSPRSRATGSTWPCAQSAW